MPAQDLMLLTTKLYIPLPRPNLVPRPHLIERLDDGLQRGHRLTLVSAPPGFGKTTLVSEWVCASPREIAWISSTRVTTTRSNSSTTSSPPSSR